MSTHPDPHPPKNYTSSLPYDEQRIGAAAIYCSDGRFGEQMDEFPPRTLSRERQNQRLLFLQQPPRYIRLMLHGTNQARPLVSVPMA